MITDCYVCSCSGRCRAKFTDDVASCERYLAAEVERRRTEFAEAWYKYIRESDEL